MAENLVVFKENGDTIDKVSGKTLKDTSEERVCRRFVEILWTDYGHPLQKGLKYLFLFTQRFFKRIVEGDVR